MCGIVGLHLRGPPPCDPGISGRLTGDDALPRSSSAGRTRPGVAVYGDHRRCPAGYAAVLGDSARRRPAVVPDAVVTRRRRDDRRLHAPIPLDDLVDAVRGARVIGAGTDVAVFKGVGHPPTSPPTYGLASVQGWQGLAHTRMATESRGQRRRTATRSPSAPDQCLVHNGSFSNHATIRRELERRGRRVRLDNDTEVGARFVAARLGRRATTSRRRCSRLVRAASTASTRCSSPPPTASPWSATRSPASRPSIAETDD